MKFNEQLKEYVKHIPLRLRIARIARGFHTLTAFAITCGVPMPRYRTHELGENIMAAPDIIRYAKTLKISTQWLLTGEGNPLDETYRPTAEEKAEFNYRIKIELLSMEWDEKKQQALNDLNDENQRTPINIKEKRKK